MSEGLSVKTTSYSIVTVGQFNPRIFHPSWLVSNDVVNSGEVTESDVEIITPQLTIFKIADVRYQIDVSRMSLACSNVSMPLVPNLVAQILTLLEHTPLIAVGFNYEVVYEVPDEAAWHRIGHELAPKSVWKDIIEDPGMLSLTIQGKRAENASEHVEFRTQPILPNDNKNAISIAVNQHYRLSRTDSSTRLNNGQSDSKKNDQILDDSAEKIRRHLNAQKILADDWRDFVHFSRTSVENVLNKSLRSMWFNED